MKTAPCTIGFANSKGGCSKTTLIANLAVRASLETPKVALLDYDPQQSLARWYELRGNVVTPRVWNGDHGAREDVPLRKREGAEWIMLDLPPATMHLIEAGIDASDFVVIPVRASPIDLEAVDPIVELCRDYRRDFAFVLTQFDSQWKLSESAAPFLEKKAPGHVLQEVFGYRNAYVGSMIGGQTGPEFNQDRRQAKAAEVEVDALWKEIKKRALGSKRPGGK
jgi:chromosome partitioning protein